MMYLGNEIVSVTDVVEKAFNFTSLTNGGYVRYNEALNAFDIILPDDQLNALSDNIVKNSVITMGLSQKADLSAIPDVSKFITKDVNNLTNYTNTTTLNNLLSNKVTYSDISNFITKDVNNLTNYYNKNNIESLLDDKANISDLSEFITKDVNDLSNYTSTDELNVLLNTKLNVSDLPTNHVTTDTEQTINASKTIIGNLTVEGNITQIGEQYITHAEQVETTDDYIIMRKGATGSLGSGFSGFEIEKYDGENNGRLVVDSNGVARVGDVGDEQPLLTRAESSELTDGQVLIWDSNNNKAVGSSAFVKQEDFDKLVNNEIVIKTRDNGSISIGGTENLQSNSIVIGNGDVGPSSGRSVNINPKKVIGYGHSAVSIGYNAATNTGNNYVVNIGYEAQIGPGATKAIQLGQGTNKISNTFQVFNDNIYNHETHTLTVQNIELNGVDIKTTIPNFTATQLEDGSYSLSITTGV